MKKSILLLLALTLVGCGRTHRFYPLTPVNSSPNIPAAAPTLAMDHVLFRVTQTSVSSEGFYIDQFEQKTYNMAKPDTVIQLYKTGFEQ